MYKPKYLTREFVVYRDPKLDPRSEMQAGGVVQREGFKNGPPKTKRKRGSLLEAGKTSENIIDAFIKAHAKDDISFLSRKTNVNSNGMLGDSEINILKRTIDDPRGIQAIVDKTGLDADIILDMLDERDAFNDLELRDLGAKKAYTPKLEKYNQFLSEGENWLIKNSKNYDTVKDLKKGFKRVFGKDHPFLKSQMATTKGLTKLNPLFFEYKKKGPTGFLYTKNEMNNLFQASLYNFNPEVRDQVLNEFDDLLKSELKSGNKERYALRKKFKNNKLFEELGIHHRLNGPIVRLVSQELNRNLNEVINQLNLIKYPRLGTVNYINYLKDIVDPKYKKQFQLVVTALNTANASGRVKKVKDALKISEKINFDHKIPKYIIDAGYADEIEYIKINPVGENFNSVIKNNQFDQKIARLTREYEASPKNKKSKVVEKMNKVKNDFNKRYNNYLGDIKIQEINGKLNFSSPKQPLIKSFKDVETSIKKSFKENPQLFQVAEASFGDVCRVKKSAGGRVPGEDYNACIARNFNETVGDVTSTDDAKRAKATTKLMQMGRGAAKLGKGALKGLQAVLIGTGAGEIAATAVLEAAAPIYNYFEGEELERVFASAPILGFALSKIDPENFSDEALEKIVYGQGLTDEEIIDAEIVANQLRRYKKMTDLFRQRESLLEYEDQLISEGAQPGIVDDKIAEIDKQVAAEAAQFAKEGNEVTKERIMSFDKGIKNYAEETQFQKEKRFVNKYLTNPAASPLTPGDIRDRKKASLIGEFFGDLSPVDGPLYQIGQNLTPELRTIATPEVKDYYNFAEGGIVERKGFANGPKITRRGFIGAAAALIASLKLGSFGQTGKKVTTEVAKKVIKDAPKGTPDWFAPLVDKVFKEGVDAGETMKTTTSREVAKKLEVKNPETNTTETYFLYENPDTGEIRIDIDAPFLGANDGEFSLYMRPDRVDGVTDDGRPILEEGEFFVTEERAVGRSNGPDDFDIELETIDTDLSGSASDYHRVEEFATGKTDKKAQAEQLKKKDYIEKNPGDDIESRYGPYDDTPPDDYYD